MRGSTVGMGDSLDRKQGVGMVARGPGGHRPKAWRVMFRRGRFILRGLGSHGGSFPRGQCPSWPPTRTLPCRAAGNHASISERGSFWSAEFPCKV